MEDNGRPAAKSPATPRYVAFLSYSHADESIGDWLHRRIESYQIPASLVGRSRLDASMGKSLGKVFRDRADLAASDDLSREIRRALEASDALIVLCSPRSARSRYVQEEIRRFKELGESRRILAAIIDGEPHAVGKPGYTADDECFPRALLNRLDANGQISDTPEDAEPIAADFRENKDGRERAAMKLIAGLMGVDLDELVRREKQAELERRRRARRNTAVMVLLAVGAVAGGGIGFWQRHVADTHGELAAGRSLAVSAQELAQENGETQRDILAALIVEAIKRIPPEEAASLAATVAVRLGQDVVLDAEPQQLDVQFLAGKDELAAVGFGTGLHLINVAEGRVRKVDSKQLGATGKSAPNSSFGARDPSGRYLAVESHGTSYIVDAVSLHVKEIPAESWSVRFSEDSRFVASVFKDYANDLIKLATFTLPGFDRRDLVIGEPGIYRLKHFDGQVALLADEGRPLWVIQSDGKRQAFVIEGDLQINSVVSDGRAAYLAMGRSTRQNMSSPDIPPPPGASSSSSASAPPKERQHETALKLAKGAPSGAYRMNWNTGLLDSFLVVSDAWAVQLSPDKERLFVRGADQVCWSQLGSGGDPKPRCVTLSSAERCRRSGCSELSSNGRWLAAKTDSGWQLIDVQTDANWSAPQDRPEAAFLLSASPLALLVGDRDILLVDLQRQQIRARIRGRVSVEHVAMSDDGQFLAFGSQGSVRVARLSPNALSVHLCQQPGRNLDSVQWDRYLRGQPWKATCPSWK